MGRILAIDWGKKRIGLALSDLSHTLASPYRTLDASPREQLLKHIGEIISEEEIEQIVIGLPLNMNGSESKSSESARILSEQLKEFEVPVEEYDERLSSFEATRILQQNKRKPSRNKGLVDRAAATIILQNYLDERAK